MVKVPEYWIVKKGRQWLMTTRHEDLSSPKAHIWSINTYDAAKHEQIRDAKRMAWEVGGVVYRYIPAIIAKRMCRLTGSAGTRRASITASA